MNNLHDNSNLNEETIFELFKNPIQFLKESSKYGIKSLKRFFSIAILFGVANTILFLFSIYRIFLFDFSFKNLNVLIGVFGFCILATFYAIFKAYNYIITDVLKVFYTQIKPLIKKGSSLLIDKSEGLLKTNQTSDKKRLLKSINIKKLLKNTFNKLPNLLGNALTSLLLQIPIIEMLIEVSELIIDDKKIEANNQFFQKIDNFIVNSIFEGNNTLWIWWMLPLNVIGMIIIILSKIN